MAEYYQNLRLPTLRDIVRALGALLGVMLVVVGTWMRWRMHQNFLEIESDFSYKITYLLEAVQIFALGVFLLIPYRMILRSKIAVAIFCWLIIFYAFIMTRQAFGESGSGIDSTAATQCLPIALIALAQAYLVLRPASRHAATPVPAS
ncbi:hypothetical protein [Cerasicoccus maritimus]|uniref:hypothetical protein n=1 Tax=Cerasicoccus maritimus TaxID=490089 RepID=UPI00285259A8|nr:hypothetical protein [Cerasicoccus maritimus]